MAIAAYIKEIGRGKEGARALSTEQAFDLMSQVLAGQVTDLELGAFCLAMRIKGETAQELDGFVRATHAHCLDLRPARAEVARVARVARVAPVAPVGRVGRVGQVGQVGQGAGVPPEKVPGLILLPSYNGARKLPNLTPLLAWALAQRGVSVLVHGLREDPTRITSAQVFAAGGWPVVDAVDAVDGAAALGRAWAAGQPAFMPTEVLCPPLARLLAVRWVIGLRNPGHTLAKLINPLGQGMQVVNHTHPEYGVSLAEYIALGRVNALLMRGTEGEPVADARRQPRFDVFLRGQREPSLCRAPQDGVLTALPDLPQGREAEVTARWTQSVIDGHTPLPAAIAAQADCLVEALAGLSERPPLA